VAGSQLAVGALADGEDHRVAGERLLRAVVDHGSEAPGVVEHARHRHERHARDAAVGALDAAHAPAQPQVDPLARGGAQLIGLDAQLVARFERHDVHLAGAQAVGGARRVHRGVGRRTLQRDVARGAPGRACGVEGHASAAHHHHTRAHRRRRPATGGEQEVERPVRAGELAPRHVERAPLAASGGEEERRVRVEQRLHRDVVPDAHAEPHLDAERAHRVDLAVEHRARQAEVGDGERHHPAEPPGRIVERDGVAHQPQRVGGREPRRPAADDADRGARRRGHRAVRGVPARGAVHALDPEPLGGGALERADRDRRVELPPSAGRLRTARHRRAHRCSETGCGAVRARRPRRSRRRRSR
jgi:hypothetical protein